jgi:hypothetical protein
MAEFRAYRSDIERMLHLRARTFAPLRAYPSRPYRVRECMAFQCLGGQQPAYWDTLLSHPVGRLLGYTLNRIYFENRSFSSSGSR